jgi:outer membrane receptor protein involved in Fe transport
MVTAGRIKGRFFASAGIAALSLAALAGPAYAQESDPECIDADEDGECDVPAVTPATEGDGVITVTGSRIRLPAAATSQEPIVVLDEEYIEDRNLTNVADALNELPIYQGSVTPAGGQGSFGQGVNFVNTFGLGSNRTLTLINGRRFVNSNPPTVFNNASAGTQVDLNVVPTVLIDRVDIVAVGGAPIYGSDAIAGTTNVILNTRFDDIVLSGTTGVTERGDNFRYNVSAVAGFNFLDDTLNVTASISHDEIDGLLQNDRELFRQNIQNLSNNVPEGSLADSLRVNPNLSNDTGDSDGNPPFVQFRDTSLPFLSRGGVIFGGPLSLQREFDSDGNLVPYDTGFIINGIRGIGGDGFQFSDFSQITSDLRRTSANLFVTWEFTPNIEAYVEGTYFKSRADELVQQPSFNTVLFGGASGGLVIRNDNPFLNDQARGVLADAGVTQFTLSRVNLDLADLTGFGENEIKRGVVGLRGEFDGLGRVWNFDVSYNRGQAELTTFGQDINSQNFINAVNVTRDGSGNIVCTTDPTRNGGSGFAAPGGAPVADASCVPLNLLGEGRASEAALDYIIQDTTAIATLDQEVINANIGSTLFDLWGAGPIGFNVGYEHRREEGAFMPDDFQQEGLGRSVAIEPVSGSYNLDEVFGEVLVPLVSPENDFPVIESAEVFGRARYVDNTVNGGFTSWAVGGRLSPIRDITFRGNITKSFRAPAISELFSPQAGAFGFIAQPCENTSAGPNPTVRATNCAAFLDAFPNANQDPSADASIPILVGGNPNLQNEEADAWTVGAVFQPRFLNNFVLAVDYVNVEINNPIIFLGTADIVAGCFDNPDFDTTDPANANQFCSLIRRQPEGTIGTLPDGTTGDIGGFVINDPLNPGVATGFANGVQFNYEALQGVMSWSLPNIFGTSGTLALNGSALYTLKRDANNLGVTTTRSDGTFGDPTFSAQFNVRYFTDDFGALWSTNFVGRQLATRDERSIEIREFNERDPYALFNASVYFNVEEDFRLTFAVTNVLDRIAQNEYFGASNGVADSLGRRFSVTARTRF